MKKIKPAAGKLKTLVILDAHAIIHRAYHALPRFTSSPGTPTGALYGLSAMLLRLFRELQPDYVVACYDRPEPTFRKQLYDEYKAGRKKTDDELNHQLERSREIFAAFDIPCYELPGFEADDLIGTIVAKERLDQSLKIIIASGDMDTLQLVDDDRVVVYTLKKGIKETILYNQAAVLSRFGFPPARLPDYKGLAGDPSDNIIGIKGIGEKTAGILVGRFGSLEALYRQLKRDQAPLLQAGIKERVVKLLIAGEEEALFSKALATIHQNVPLNFIRPAPFTLTGRRERVEVLFNELGFRSLLPRLNQQLGVSRPPPDFASAPDTKQAAIACWLLNSELTNPTLADIQALTQTTDLNLASARLRARLREVGLLSVYEEIELPLIPILASAAARGILVDRAGLLTLSHTVHRSLEQLEKKIWQLTGREFNLNSPKQLAVILFEELKLPIQGLKKTAGGARSTRESELRKLEPAHPIVPLILDHREKQKLLSTYIDAIPALLDATDRLHTTFNQTGTTTGRISSTNPNLQNIPAGSGLSEEIRRAFRPTSGHSLAAFDYSQIEMRVLALLSGDEALREIFISGADVHTEVAARVFKVLPTAVTAEMRRRAKVINFGIIYGMGVNALRANLGSSRAEAALFYDNFFATFPTLRRYFNTVISEASSKGYTETYFHRRRYFPALKSALPWSVAEAGRMAMNAPLQGTAADLVKIAMRQADDSLRAAGLLKHAHLLLQVHDELLYEIEESYLDQALPLIKTAMESALPGPVPFPVTTKVGPTWADLKPIA